MQLSVGDKLRPYAVDYLALGPIFGTGSKQNPDPVVGLDELQRLCPLTERLLVAIGGITCDNAREVLAAGANSLAVIGDLFPQEGNLRCTSKSGRASLLWRQIDEHNVRVFAQTVEHDLLAVRRDVEGAHGGRIVEMSEGAGPLRGQIEQPEVLGGKWPLHVNQRFASGQKAAALSPDAHPDGRQFNGSSIRPHGHDGRRKIGVRTVIDD